MSDQNKYVILDQYGVESAIIFSSLISHDAFKELKPVSAGFVTIFGGDKEWNTITCSKELIVHVHGRSSTLGLAARDGDAEIIKKMLKMALV